MELELLRVIAQILDIMEPLVRLILMSVLKQAQMAWFWPNAIMV